MQTNLNFVGENSGTCVRFEGNLMDVVDIIISQFQRFGIFKC